MGLVSLLNPSRLLPRSGKSGSVTDRRWQRVPCQLLAVLTLPAAQIELDGLLMEVSRGGILFRPASKYILDRTQDRVIVALEGMVLAGVIARTMPKGYGIALDETLSDRDLDKIIALSAAEPSKPLT